MDNPIYLEMQCLNNLTDQKDQLLLEVDMMGVLDKENVTPVTKSPPVTRATMKHCVGSVLLTVCVAVGMMCMVYTIVHGEIKPLRSEGNKERNENITQVLDTPMFYNSKMASSNETKTKISTKTSKLPNKTSKLSTKTSILSTKASTATRKSATIEPSLTSTRPTRASEADTVTYTTRPKTMMPNPETDIETQDGVAVNNTTEKEAKITEHNHRQSQLGNQTSLKTTIPASQNQADIERTDVATDNITAEKVVMHTNNRKGRPKNSRHMHSKRRNIAGVLSVDNGGKQGAWYRPQFCPLNTFAVGFNMKYQQDQGKDVDDTALNGISLQCADKKGVRRRGHKLVHSASGHSGRWTGDVFCLQNHTGPYFMKGFSLYARTEEGTHNGDAVSAISVRFICNDIQGDKVPDQLSGNVKVTGGQYGSWSESCPRGSAICGIQSRVEGHRNDRDNTALNDVLFYCCTVKRRK